MLEEVSEKTLSALKVIEELDQNCPNLQAELEPIITTADITDVGGFIRSRELYVLISNYSTNTEFLDEASTDKISTLLVRYIFIDYYYKINNPEPNDFEELQQFVTTSVRLNTILGHWNGSFRVIAYQDYFKKFTWNEYALKSKWDWTEIRLLDNSLPCCSIKVETLFEYLRSTVLAHPNDMAIPRLGSNVVAKIRMDATLKSNVENRISEIISTEHLSTFLPSFLLGVIENETDFNKWFAELAGSYATHKAFTILYGLGVACPNEESCLKNLKLEVDRCLINEKLSPAECIQLYSLKNFISDDVLDYLSELSSATKNSDELTAILQYLLNNLDIHFNSKWFLTILTNVVQIDDEKNIGMLNHLVYLLLEKDINLIYELISQRFEALGSKNFLKENWFELVSANKQLFSVYITKWLNSDNTNVHRALLKLCTVYEIAPSDFKINTELLLTFSLRDKLYIAIKIIGFIYSKDHLQALMFSLVEVAGQEETILIDNLFMLFYNYVVYNYRTSLDTIKEILKEERLPEHILNFYNDLNESYEQYFRDLGRIENYPELHPDQILVQHIQFYTQNQFSEKSKNIGKTGLAALFKNTPIHSHRWAIRRENELIHQPSPLGHFKTSMEFPSGERLNPIYQETMRRTYQRMKRDEININ